MNGAGPLGHGIGVVEERRDLVKPGFDRDAHAGRQIAIETQEPIARARRARAARRVSGAIAEVLHVVHVEPEQVSDAVRKKQRAGSALVELRRIAAQDAELDQPADELATGGAVDVEKARAGPHARERGALRREHDLVELALRRREPARYRPRPRDVACPPLGSLRADVGEEQIRLPELAMMRGRVQDLAVHRHDGSVRGRHAVSHDDRLHRGADQRFADARSRRGEPRGVGLRRHFRRELELLDRRGVVLETELDDGVGEREIGARQAVASAGFDVAPEQIRQKERALGVLRR